LVELYLSHNQITAAPDITGLTKLKWLNLHDNHMTAPPVVTGLRKLERLILDSNLCDDQDLLESLRVLNRGRNPFSLVLWSNSNDTQGNRVQTAVSLN